MAEEKKNQEDEYELAIKTFKKTYNANHLRILDDTKIREVQTSTNR
jgi:hypothetical protein